MWSANSEVLEHRTGIMETGVDGDKATLSVIQTICQVVIV